MGTEYTCNNTTLRSHTHTLSMLDIHHRPRKRDASETGVRRCIGFVLSKNLSPVCVCVLRCGLCGALCRGVSRVVPGLAPPSPPRCRCGLPAEPRRDIRLRPVHPCACRCRPDHRLPPPRQPTRRRVTAVVECASKRRGLASAAWFASAGLLPPSGRFFSFAGFVHRRCATWLCRESSRLGSRCAPLLREEPRGGHTRVAFAALLV